jgi:hypothetical protein
VFSAIIPHSHVNFKYSFAYILRFWQKIYRLIFLPAKTPLAHTYQRYLLSGTSSPSLPAADCGFHYIHLL